MYSVDNQLKIEDFIFPYGKLANESQVPHWHLGGPKFYLKMKSWHLSFQKMQESMH